MTLGNKSQVTFPVLSSSINCHTWFPSLSEKQKGRSFKCFMASWLLFSSCGLGLYKTGYSTSKNDPERETASWISKQAMSAAIQRLKGVKRLQRLQEPHCEKNNEHTIKTNTIFQCLLARSWQAFFSCRIKTFLPPLNFLKNPLVLSAYCELRSQGAKVSSA